MTRIFFELVKRAKIDALGVAMPGARLPERVRQIVNGGAATRISGARVALLAAAFAALCVTFASGTLTDARQISSQSASTSSRPKFDVASVKPCGPQSGGRGPGGSGVGTSVVSWSPGRITMNCEPVDVLILAAYVVNSYGQNAAPSDIGNSPEMDALLTAQVNTPVNGLPDWTKSEGFTINAVASDAASEGMMMGPMLQSLLEERFQLKLHSATQEVPVYDLIVAKGGPKLPQTDPICEYLDPKNPGGPLLGPAAAPRCSIMAGPTHPLSMAGLAQLLTTLSWGLRFGIDRRVVDKTGISGKYSILLLFDLRPDQDAAAPDAPPSVFTALQEQLGLKLVPSKGPGESLVVDHIEEPSPN